MKIRFFLFFLVISGNFFAQSDSAKQYKTGVNYGFGFILPHSPVINYLAKRPINSKELYFESQNFKKSAWHKNHNFPNIGIAFTYFNLNNKVQFGNVFSLAPYAKFNLVKRKTSSLKIKTALGVGFIEKPFETETNFKNTAIGSKINMFISINLEQTTRLTNYLELNIGLAFSHFSNAGFKTPNLGINMPTLNLGLNYNFGDYIMVNKGTKQNFKKEKGYWHLSSGFGLNEINPPNGRKYLAKALFVKREKRISKNSSLGVGLDFFYNPANIEILKNKNEKIKGAKNLQIGISVGHLLHFGKLDFTSQLSYYIKSKNKELGNIYHVFGGRFKLNETYNLFFLGKTHISKAEYLMVGVGIKLVKNE